MLILAGFLITVFGCSLIALKDLWWRDKQLLHQYFGITVVRSSAWERQQNLWGMLWCAAGVVMLVYALITTAL